MAKDAWSSSTSQGSVWANYLKQGAKISAGGFGFVSEAVSAKTGARVAVKSVPKLPPSAGRSLRRRDKERLQQEVSIMKLVQNGDHVVRLQDTFEDDCFVYMVMELCEGGELVSYILEHGSHSEAQVVLVMRQVFLAVAYLHSCAVCHRDLKPENLLLLSRGPIARNVLKVADFGLSALCPPGSELRGVVGTVPYLAPQVITGRYDVSADIWSCGVLAYLLLCGHPPFWHDQDTARTTAAIKRGNFAFPSQDWSKISQDAKRMIRSLLKMDPAERLTARGACSDPWIVTDPPSTVLDDTLQRLRRFMTVMYATQRVSEDTAAACNQSSRTPTFLVSVFATFQAAGCCSSNTCSSPMANEVHMVRPDSVPSGSEYTVGMKVLYRSATHGAWLPTVVIDINDLGDIELEIKPRIWIAPEDQVNLIRPQG